MVDKKTVYSTIEFLIIFNLLYIFILSIVNIELLNYGRYFLVLSIFFNTLFLKMFRDEVELKSLEHSVLPFKKILYFISFFCIVTTLELIYLFILLKDANLIY